MSVRAAVAETVNAGLRPVGVQLVPGTSPDPAIKTYIPARKTIAAARRAGLSVGAWIDQNHAEPGATADLVNAMLGIAGLHEKCDTVCEIGPGSGRYAEVVTASLSPNA